MSDIAKSKDNLQRFSPATDILEMADGFHIILDLPGVKREDLVIDLKEGELTISGESSYGLAGQSRLVHSEFGPARFVRNFQISDSVDGENIKANLKNGVLNLYLPKAERAKPRKIEIEAG